VDQLLQTLEHRQALLLAEVDLFGGALPLLEHP
jgi:hypothetical protein